MPRMHGVEMGEHQDAGSIATPRTRDQQMISPPIAAGNSLNSGTSLGITFGDVRHQMIDAFNIGCMAFNLLRMPSRISLAVGVCMIPPSDVSVVASCPETTTLMVRPFLVRA